MDWVMIEKVFGTAGAILITITAIIVWAVYKTYANANRIEEVRQYLIDLAKRLDDDEQGYRQEKVCLQIHDALNGRLDRFREDALNNHSIIIEKLNKQDEVLTKILLNGKGG